MRAQRAPQTGFLPIVGFHSCLLLNLFSDRTVPSCSCKAVPPPLKKTSIFLSVYILYLLLQTETTTYITSYEKQITIGVDGIMPAGLLQGRQRTESGTAASG